MLKSISLLFVVVTILFSPALFSQQPANGVIIVADSVWWGGFDVHLKYSFAGISSTQWTIMNDSGDILYDTRRTVERPDCYRGWRSMVIPSGDTRDLIYKRIIGCMPGQVLTATAQSNLTGAPDHWNYVVAPVKIVLPERPLPATRDTVRVILWGQSLLRWEDGCVIAPPLISPRASGVDVPLQDGFLPLFGANDSYGHALQTRLQRLMPDTTVIVINAGWSRSYQHDWVYWDTPAAKSRSGTDSARMALYDPGQRFGDIKKYPVAVMMHGHDDVDDNYVPAEVFAKDIDSISTRLTDLGIQVIYNSIHFAPAKESYPGKQEAYFHVWDSVMNLKAHENPRLFKGVDLYHLFLGDTTLFVSYDGEHPNISEGASDVVTQLADKVVVAIRNIASGVKEGADPMGSLALSCTPNPLSNAAVIRYSLSKPGRVNLSIVDPSGRVVENLLDADQEAGQHFYRFDATVPFASGAYLCRLEAGGKVETKTVFVVR